MSSKNMMQEVNLEKVTLNFGAGKDQKLLEKGAKLIKNLSGKEPVKTKTKKRIPSWGLRPGLPIGCKLTLRKKDAEEMLARFLSARSGKLKMSQFDENGNVSFGVSEYIDIKDAKYDAEIGVIGIECAVSLAKPGYRVKHRRIRPSKVGKNQQVTKEEAIKFMQESFKVKVE